MNLTTQDLLKHSLVINIDDERLKWFKKVFKFHGLTPMPRKFQGTTLWYNSPQYNCYLSHRNAILTAKKRKWPYVCVFEDDAYPCVNVVEEIDKYLRLLPDDCQVLSLGNIMMWAANADDPNFYRSYQIYGAHAYVVFQSAYDKYIQMLDKAPEGDGAFYSRFDDILPKDSFYMPKKNLFLQYNNAKSMNNFGGFTYLDIKKCTLVDGKFQIPIDKSISEDEAVEMGFPSVGEIK